MCEWTEYQRWLDTFGERCPRCGLPVFWHSRPQGAYQCIVNAQMPPDDTADQPPAARE